MNKKEKRNFKQLIITIIISCLLNNVVFSQQAVLTSGGDNVASNGSISFSVGQVVFSTDSNNYISIEQGIQHSSDLFVVTAIQNILADNIFITVFPNPACDFIMLNLSLPLDDLEYKLFDLNGNIVLAGLQKKSLNCISLANLAPSVYFLKVFRHNNEIQTFKVLKK